jgi:C4-dicarboxylate transporter, DctQ subunit
MSTTEEEEVAWRRAFHWLSRMSNLLSTLGAAIASLMLIAMVFLVAYGAIFRYLGVSTVGIDELGGFAMVGIAFLPLGFVLMKGKHISVDVLVKKAGSKTRKALFIICNCVASLFYCGILMWSSLWLIKESYSMQSMSTILRIPIYVPQIGIAFGTCILILSIMVDMISRAMIFSEEEQGG